MFDGAFLFNVAGGAALLLWGARMVRTGILRAYGGDMRRVLGHAAGNRFIAFAMGLGVAGAVQSSTAVALLAVAFASKGLLATAPGLAIMLGADLGSTLVVQVLSFDLSWLAPVLILAGVMAFMTGPSQYWRHIGRALIGLGLMLLSLGLIVGASASLRESATLQSLLALLAGQPLAALLLGALLAWAVHSSVAVVLLVMSLTTAGVVPPALGFALVLGANLGSGLIPLALTWTAAPAARRIPLCNLAFRLLGAVLVLPLLDIVGLLVAALDADPARQIANFHSLFNLALAVLFLPVTGPAARLAERALPDRAEEAGAAAPRYLDAGVVDRPKLALSCATREVMRMADAVETMLSSVMDVFRKDDAKLLETLSNLDDEVDELHESIKLYLTRVSRNELREEDSRRCVDLITLTTNLEHVGDIIDNGLLELARKKIKSKLHFSDKGWEELTVLHARTLGQMQLAMSALVSGDLETARQLIVEKEGFRALTLQAEESHLERLRGGRVESIETSALHLDILRDLKRVNSHLTSVAYPILEASGELRQSRLKVRPKMERGQSFGS